MPNLKKEQTIEKIQTLLEKSEAVAFADYRGLSASLLETLRNNIKETGGYLHIFKNSLVSIALDRAEFEKPEESVLDGPTAVVFGTEQMADTLKTLDTFAKENELPTVKGGYLGKAYVGPAKVTAIANLPSTDQLRANLLGQLNAPITGLVYQLNGQITKLIYTLNAVKDKK